MRILVLGRKNLNHLDDVAEEYEIAKTFMLLGNQVDFLENISELTGEKYDWAFVTKSISKREEILEIKHMTRAKVAYWLPDYSPMKDMNSGDLEMLGAADLILHHMPRELPLNSEKYLYWNFDVAWDIFQKESGRSIHWTDSQRPHPDDIPVGFIGNWVHNPFRANYLRSIQYALGDDMLHITGASVKEWTERDDLRSVHYPAYGHKFNYLVDITRITLCIENVDDQFWTSRTARTMAAGGFCLVRYVKGMSKVFGDNRENVVYFNTLQQCLKEIKYYLEHEDERKVIAERGNNFANNHLRPINRIRGLCEELEKRL